MEKLRSVNIEISTTVILKLLLIGIGLLLAWYLRAVLFMLFFAFILYSAFDPIVDRLHLKKVPRKLSILLIYLVLFVLISVIFVIGANMLIGQFDDFNKDFDNILVSFLDAIRQAFPWLQDTIKPEELASKITNGSNLSELLFSTKTVSSAFGVLTSIGSMVLAIFVVIMVSVYMLDRQSKFYLGLIEYLPQDQHKKIQKLMKRIEEGLGAWFKGELILMFSIGLVTWIALTLPGLFFDGYTLDQYALPLALIAGFLEAVPNVGPTIATVIAVIIAVGSGNLAHGDATTVIIFQSIYMVVLGIVVQNLEAVFLVPTVMKRVVGVDPIITVLGIISAFSVFGIVGALLIIPLIATGQIIFEFFREESKLVNSD